MFNLQIALMIEE